jgi:hypothetical protein
MEAVPDIWVCSTGFEVISIVESSILLDQYRLDAKYSVLDA